MTMEREEFLINYLRELRLLRESGINCNREINEVLEELRKLMK